MTGFSKTVRELVLKRASGHCERCGGVSFRYEHHHRRPRAMGGSKRADTNEPANCLLLCLECHRAIEMNRAEALDHGWLVPQGCTPSEVAVLRRGTWVLLFDDGSVKPARQGE